MQGVPYHTVEAQKYFVLLIVLFILQVDGSGVHVNGEGKYGFCSSSCSPTVSLAAILGGLGGVNINNAEITKTINNDNSKAKLQRASASFRRLELLGAPRPSS